MNAKAILRPILLSMAIALIPLCASAQSEKIDTKEGNEEYRSGRYDQAISAYTRALKENPDYAVALFNTGNALQEKARRLFEKAEATEDPEGKKALVEEAKKMSEKAASQYASVAGVAKTREEKNKTNYNLGNARLLSGEIDQSIEAYKEALRNDPLDDDARYNLAYAQHLKKEQQNKSQDQEKQEQNQDEQKKEQDRKDQQDQQDQKDQKDQESQPQRPEDMTQEEAEKLLQALTKQEKDLQEKLKKKNRKAVKVKIEKDW